MWFCLLQATKLNSPSATSGSSTPALVSSFIIKLGLFFTVFLHRNHNTNRKSLNSTYNFRREKPKQLIKTWKAQANYCVLFMLWDDQHTFCSSDKLNFIFTIRYKSSVKITTNWATHHIKLATSITFWKGFTSQHIFVLKAVKTFFNEWTITK